MSLIIFRKILSGLATGPRCLRYIIINLCKNFLRDMWPTPKPRAWLETQGIRAQERCGRISPFMSTQG